MPVIRLVSSSVLLSTSTPSPTRSMWSVNAGVTTDVLGLTETWHEDADYVALRPLRTTGLQMLERARPVQPGARISVAVVTSSAVRLSNFSAPFEPMTCEHLIARVTVSGSLFIFMVIYRPGSAAV